MRKILAAGCLLCASFPVAAAAEALHVEAGLIANGASPARDAPRWVGLKMRHQAGWHTYWKNPGDAGMPTRIDWSLPAGWSAGGIEWPAPTRIQLGPLASYGYEGDLVLPVKLIPPSNWDAKLPVQISAKANWLVCKDTCIPESGNFALNLPARVSGADRKLFEAWRERVPQAFRFTTASAERNAGRLNITLEPAVAGQFFPEPEELIEPGDPPQVAVTGKRATWSARLGVQGKTLAAPAVISGVWVPESGKPLFVQVKLK